MRGEPGRMKAKWRARESRWEGELWVEPHASLSAAQRSAGSAGAALLSKSTAAQQGGKNEPNIQTQSKRWSQSRRDRWDGRGERKWGTRTLVTTSAGKSKERAWARRGREREGRWEKVLMAEVWWFTPPGPESDPLHPCGFPPALSLYPFSDPIPSSFTPLSHIPSLAHHSHSQTRRRELPVSHLCLSVLVSCSSSIQLHSHALRRKSSWKSLHKLGIRGKTRNKTTCGGMISRSCKK